MIRIFFFFWLLVMIISCTRNKLTLATKEQISIHSKCSISKNKGWDSDIGTIACGKSIFTYDYGRYSNPGPLTEIEKFLMAFRGKHHVNFFERVYLDPKLFNAYIDSVQVIKIEELKEHNKSLLFQCSACNRVAILKFKKGVHRFPFFSDQKMTIQDDYIFYIDTIGSFYRKIYLSNTKGTSGMYLSPLVNKNQSNKLSLQTDDETEHHYLLELMKSVRIFRN